MAGLLEPRLIEFIDKIDGILEFKDVGIGF